MNDQAKFWMVYGIGQREPTFQHWTKDAARKEASRLALANPGSLFVVLAAVDAFRATHPLIQEVPIVRRPPMDDDIPF
jgi:SAM-dependent MidA family methyltransferase